MNAEDLYCDREDLMSPEELEEFHHHPGDDEIPTFTPTMRAWLLDGTYKDGPFLRSPPEEACRDEFEARKPALSASQEIIDETRSHNLLLPPVQQRSLLFLLRNEMLRNLISCDGASTLDELLDILLKELDGGVASPVPDWYVFPTVTHGPRKTGYDGCANRGCFKTETLEAKFARCAKCKLPYYCSKECQTEDWRARHKHVCKDAAKQREKIAKTGQFMQAFAANPGMLAPPR